MHIRPLMLVIPLLATAGAAHARPYKEVCDNFEPFRKIADLKYVKPVVRVKPKDEAVKPKDVVITIDARAGTVRIVPEADGSIQLPMTDALCQENPEFSTNQGEGNVRFSVSIDPQLPPVKALDYRLLETLRQEWDTAVSRQNMMMRMLAPSAKGYHLNFEPGKPATAEVKLPSGAQKFTADAAGNLYLPLESSWATANPAIVLSEMPKRIGLKFKS